MPLFTVGHGTLDQEVFGSLLQGAGVVSLVDVRSYPGSRRHPHVGRDLMARWLPERGIAYRWEPRLGGRRRPRPDSPHVALRHENFRGYADHMETDDFRAALREVLEESDVRSTTVLCSESVWWRCHRRLLADAAVLAEDADVRHLMHDGRLTPHRPTDGVRPAEDGVVYDVGVDAPML